MKHSLSVLLVVSIFNAFGYSSKGLLVINSNISQNATLTILNGDNSIYTKFSIMGDTTPNTPKDFSPFIIDLPNSILVIEVISEDSEKYKILSGKGVYKFIKKSEHTVKFLKWEAFVLKYDYVSLIIDKSKNPIRLKANLKSSKVSYIDYDTDNIDGIKIVGEWLKVKIENLESFEKTVKYGWVKWKNKNSIIIDFRFYD